MEANMRYSCRHHPVSTVLFTATLRAVSLPLSEPDLAIMDNGIVVVLRSTWYGTCPGMGLVAKPPLITMPYPTIRQHNGFYRACHEIYIFWASCRAQTVT